MITSSLSLKYFPSDPACSQVAVFGVKGLSWRTVLLTALLWGGVWPSRPPETRIVQWLFTAPVPLGNKAGCSSGLTKPEFLPLSSGEMRFLLDWSRAFNEDMFMAVEKVRDDRVIIRLLAGIAWQCSPWKWERLFSADGILLTVSAFSVSKRILVLLQLVWQLLLLFCQAALVCHLSTSAASV